jgi:hypothetical protein
MCLEEKISGNEEGWETDRVGISSERVVKLIRDAVLWLLGKNPDAMKDEKDIGTYLDSYFASDKDTRYLLDRVNKLDLRVEALENTMNDVASDAYCKGKLKVMLDYGLQGVKCNDTTYFNHHYSPTGEEMIIGITPVNENGEEEKPEIPEEIPTENNETEFNESALLSGQESSTESQTTTTTIDIKKIIQFGLNMQVPKPIEDLIANSAVLISSFTVTISFLTMGFPFLKGYHLRNTPTKERTNNLIKNKNIRKKKSSTRITKKTSRKIRKN